MLACNVALLTVRHNSPKRFVAVRTIPNPSCCMSVVHRSKPMVQQSIHTTEEEYRFLFENNPQPMWVYDIETFRFLAVNESAIEKYGYSQEEFLGMTIEQICPPKDIPALHETLERLEETRTPDPVWRHVTKDGSLLYVEIKSRATTFAGSRARFVLVHDVTTRVLAEQALSLSDARLRTLLETTTAAIFFYRIDRFEFVNQATERITGYSRHELANMRLWNIVHPEHRDMVIQRAAARLRGETVPSRYEVKIVTKAGETRWIDLAVALLQLDGEAAILGTGVDITEQRNIQNMLLESEEKFRTLTETTSAAIFFYQGEQFNYVNQAMERITGYSREELERMRFSEIVHPDHREMVRQRAFTRQQGKEIPPRYELKILNKQGATRWLDMAPSVVELNGKKVLMGTAVDITERKRMEEELRRSEELTHRILEAVPGGIVEVDKDGNVLQANIEAQRSLGLSALDFLKLKISDFAGKLLWEDGTPVDYDDFPIVKCLKTGEDQDPVTLGIRRPDGGISWAVVTAVPLLDIATGENNGAVLTFLDITGRKRTEDALRESEERYRKFFEEDLTGDFIASNDGCILACNPAFANIFGFQSVESAMYCNMNTLFSEQHAFETITALLLQKRKIEYHEAVGKRLDGRPVYIIENLIGLFDDSEALTGVKGYVFDNTAHKTLEQQVQEAQKIESLGRLAGGIAHDFNNLLGIILGYSERLSSTKEGTTKQLQDVKAIHTAAQRGASLVRQLLTFARKTDVAFEEMNVNSVVDELGKLLKETFPRDIAFEVDTDPSIPLIIADANQIHQAVLNLCVNARDAMPAGGTLTLKTETVSGADLRTRFPETHADCYACISVTDTGIGMDEQIRSKIFEPFFSTKERSRGTGLGLSVVYGIVNTHHGIIDVASEHGKGATFSLYFPIPQSVTPTFMAEEQKKPEVPGGTETILVVEDEELLLELVQSLLESKGYNILIAKNGKEAVEIYRDRKDHIDLVLTDLGLPKLGGWEASLQIKAINPKVKVVVATGYLDPAQKQEMMETGIEEFVQKPYLATELTAKIREMLDAKRKPNT